MSTIKTTQKTIKMGQTFQDLVEIVREDLLSIKSNDTIVDLQEQFYIWKSRYPKRYERMLFDENGHKPFSKELEEILFLMRVSSPYKTNKNIQKTIFGTLPKFEKQLEDEAKLITEAVSDVITIATLNDYDAAMKLIKGQFLVIDRQDIEVNEQELNVCDRQPILVKLNNGKTIRAIPCSECENYFEEKKAVIRGDTDTCDDCLCPE